MTSICRKLLTAALAMSATLLSCSTTAEDFVLEHEGFSVIRGRITKVDGLSSHEIQPLADGAALRVNRQGCRVRVEFTDERSREIELSSGEWVVHGAAEDFILHSGRASPTR